MSGGTVNVRRIICKTGMPKPIAKSTITARRLSALLIVTDWTEAIR